ncbi:hypothetical protein TCE0_033r08538 [Talaromyces pinophilus]|uniref:ER membrane protein complex subunit 6 n=1 Tax=Talaromyces pinophilus TaxID=128442 RepID=A0A6V8H9X3_TALPI|nr:Transmembrane protein 93 [Penicillium occitanis (nom. inval.)]PCG97687.1 hypothetical protein PENOC_066920 [Penicillium occitanis (nom. inval.)]GAM38081.1 hypothetical protein TCE0_033r08538 [Talaromyces pinophilus]
MPPTRQELSLLIHPLVPEAVQHNRRVLSQLRSLTAFILGISAGILGLQSTAGFAFYFAGTLLVSGLVQILLLGPSSTSTGGAGAYFPGASGGEIEGIDDFGKIRARGGQGQGKPIQRKGAWRDVWLGGGVMGEALSGFVLGWAGVGGVLR